MLQSLSITEDTADRDASWSQRSSLAKGISERLQGSDSCGRISNAHCENLIDDGYRARYDHEREQDNHAGEVEMNAIGAGSF